MVDVHFDRPVIDIKKTPEQNLALFERWAADTVNMLNLMVTKINKELEEDE